MFGRLALQDEPEAALIRPMAVTQRFAMTEAAVDGRTAPGRIPDAVGPRS
jgi:hypothetical protein